MHPELRVFYNDRSRHIEEAGNDASLQSMARQFLPALSHCKYSYFFDWLGRPIIQIPQDIVAFQEVVWRTRPDIIVETGIAHGGSLILSASMLALLDVCDAASTGAMIDPRVSARKVIGVDIDIRAHNRELIEAHPLAPRIHMIQGSSIDPSTVEEVARFAGARTRVMVCLDSNHTHDHVLAELKAYAPLVSVGCYCIVWDTVVEDLPKSLFPDRPWGPGDNPKTAVREYVSEHPEFEIDKSIDHKILMSVAPDGYLRRVR